MNNFSIYIFGFLVMAFVLALLAWHSEVRRETREARRRGVEIDEEHRKLLEDQSSEMNILDKM